MSIRFGEFEFSSDRRELRTRDGPVHLEPQVFDVLDLLVRNRHRVVAKEELLDEVWGSRFVSVGALTTRVKTLRRAVGDSGAEQHTIKTVSRTGYRFVAEVQEVNGDERRRDFDLLTSGEGLRRRLPSIAGRFHGRIDELRQLRQRLVGERMVTVLGPGGTGKTRLCVEFAQELPRDEVAVFVDLAAVANDSSVGHSLANALGIEAGVVPDVVEACCTYMRSRRLLLILDNCEHVAAGAAALARRVLVETPATILATSRIPLDLREERLFSLDALPVPDEVGGTSVPEVLANDSVALFVDRVREVRDDFTLDESTVGPVVALCRALDGLPLAIELAACRMVVFDVWDIVGRLSQRLDLLRDERVDAVDRHRSLRETLEWSYELLDTDGQRLFDQMSVFPSGLTLDATELIGSRLALVQAPADVLEALLKASLVSRQLTPSGARYVQLETMRAFGMDRLQSTGRLQEALDLAAMWADTLVEQQRVELRSPTEPYWNDRIRRELPNLRMVREHLTATGRSSELVHLSVCLAEWSHSRNVTELWVWIDELAPLDGLDDADADRVRALAAQAAWSRGRLMDVEHLVRPVLQGSSDAWAIAHSRAALATAEFFNGDLAAAIAASEWSRESDIAAAPVIVSVLARAYAGHDDEAVECLRRMREEAERLEWPTLLAWSDYIAGELLSMTGSPLAGEHLQAALDRADVAGAEFITGVAGVTLCGISVASGNTTEAAQRYGALIEHWFRAGMWTILWTTLRNATELTELIDAGVTLLVIEMADLDPYAPRLDPQTRLQLEHRRDRVIAVLGGDIAAVRTKAATLDRGSLAHEVRRSLERMSTPSASLKLKKR